MSVKSAINNRAIQYTLCPDVNCSVKILVAFFCSCKFAVEDGQIGCIRFLIHGCWNNISIRIFPAVTGSIQRNETTINSNIFDMSHSIDCQDINFTVAKESGKHFIFCPGRRQLFIKACDIGTVRHNR